MKTKQIIEDLRCCNGGSCAECTIGMKPGCTDELMIAAEKELEKCGVAINNQKHEIDALKKHVAELKKELSEREAGQGWISVEERMPEVGEDVLIKYENNLVSGFLQLGNEWCCYMGNGWVTAADKSENPTHWMPIPAPPKPKKKVKTYNDVYLDRMKEAFPEAVLDGSVTGKCRDKLFGINKLCTYQCRDCWNQPYPEEEGESND